MFDSRSPTRVAAAVAASWLRWDDPGAGYLLGGAVFPAREWIRSTGAGPAG